VGQTNLFLSIFGRGTVEDYMVPGHCVATSKSSTVTSDKAKLTVDISCLPCKKDARPQQHHHRLN
jgi:hypothetical protein